MQDRAFLLQVDEELTEFPHNRLKLNGFGPGITHDAKVEQEIVAPVFPVMEVGGVSGDLVAKTVDSDRVCLEFVLGNDEARDTVKVLLAEEVSRPLAPDHRPLVRVELAQEHGPDVPDLSAPLVLGAGHGQDVPQSVTLRVSFVKTQRTAAAASLVSCLDQCQVNNGAMGAAPLRHSLTRSCLDTKVVISNTYYD